jgi:beta-lactamase regulating signal transducer with metallopeptidase domain
MIAQFNEIAQIWWQWMAGMFWQVSLLVILMTILDMAIRRWVWPQLRYALWALVFLKLIIPPTWQMPTSIISWLQPQVEEQISFQIGEKRSVDESLFNLLNQKQDNKTIVSRPTLKSLLFLTWFGGMTVFTLLLLKKMSRLRKWNQAQDDRDVPLWFNELLINTSQRLNLKSTPAVIFSKDVVSPAVFGILRPSLLLPTGYLDKVSEEQAEHVLLHELCHLKRGDLWTHAFCLILQIVYWFNPFLIWTRRQMRHVGEICCDLSVANVLREKTKAYRDTLLSTARELLTERVEPSLGLLGLFEEPFPTCHKTEMAGEDHLGKPEMETCHHPMRESPHVRLCDAHGSNLTICKSSNYRTGKNRYCRTIGHDRSQNCIHRRQGKARSSVSMGAERHSH